MEQDITIRNLGNVVGVYKRKRNIFVKFRKESDIFGKFNGLAISYRVLERLKTLKCEKIIILLRMDSGVTKKYITTVTRYIEDGLTYNDGFDYQKVLDFPQLEKSTDEYPEERASRLNEY